MKRLLLTVSIAFAMHGACIAAETLSHDEMSVKNENYLCSFREDDDENETFASEEKQNSPEEVFASEEKQSSSEGVIVAGESQEIEKNSEVLLFAASSQNICMNTQDPNSTCPMCGKKMSECQCPKKKGCDKCQGCPQQNKNLFAA